MTYGETNIVASIERLSGRALSELSDEQLGQFDQFHAGGTEAVDRLLAQLRLGPAMTVLDVGCGLGGPARQVGRNAGCNVVGVDITPAYVEAAQELTEATGLDDRVHFECTDVAALERTGFDAAYTMHVQMNVADKRMFFAEIAARLRPGARLAVFEVCRTGAALPQTPLPWSVDGTDSFLVSPEELRSTIESSGFDLVEWVDETAWIREWFEAAARGMAADGGEATLRALLDDGPIRMFNYASAIVNGVVSLHRGSFTINR
jgi:sarcosine/dimethylglycine N-methyltransferase